MRKIIILASGRGSNAEAIYKKSKEYGYEISAIVSDQAEALVLQKAKGWNISTVVVTKGKEESRQTHEEKLLLELKNYQFDLVILAGYERLLSSDFLSKFAPKTIINIHPSLLPEYPGMNSYGKAYNNKAAKNGITIHYVDQGIDTGEIISQFSFDAKEGDSLEEFKAQGLRLEHEHYPRVIKELLNTACSYRLEIFPENKRFLKDLNKLPVRTFWIKLDAPCAQLNLVARDVLIDSVVEDVFLNQDTKMVQKLTELGFENKLSVEVSFLPGVTDNLANSTKEALSKHPKLRGRELSVFTGTLNFFKSKTEADLNQLLYKDLANSWLEKARIIKWIDITHGERFSHIHLPEVVLSQASVKSFDLNVDDNALEKMSSNQLWALSLSELHFVRDHFTSLKKLPTEVEMEIIAQTWSEHCKHKIFSANIQHQDEDGKREVKSLFKTFIKGATSRIIEERKIDWARSVFTDNAGIVRWDKNLDVCIKVETHNSPSALDPYGGALTGILGVNRDILGCGFGAKPIANTDVFCLPPEDADEFGEWPKELHTPKRLRQGVHKGVQDGGNKSGIPTVNGAFHYDLSYAGKPLVYCGTIGVLPHMVGPIHSHEKNQMPGDYVVMVGGRIGKDGIHGATFSSEELKEGTPSTVVQIGDPLTQKRVTDFILKARDAGLYTSITDNGAGGLSSSVGEMAGLTNGACIDLALAPVKYLGLTPSELVISESQERMTCSVHPSKWEEFKHLAELFNVEVSNIGTFTADGFFIVLYHNETVAKLSLSFLHEDLPPMELTSSWIKNYPRPAWKDLPLKTAPNTLKEKVLGLLNHPNIRSHESWVRQYDHEVKAASVTKPFSMSHGPSDAAVIAMKPHGGGEKNGVVIASGLAPNVSLQDTKLMSLYAIDEAVRNAVVTGADPEQMVLIDNFCWPDPLPGPRNPDYAQKLGELVRCNEGLYEMATVLGMPFISGKDSMKNDAVVNYNHQKTKISVLPTLLITSMGHIEDIHQTVHSRFKSQEDLWLLGGENELHPFTLLTLQNKPRGEWSRTEPIVLKERYQVYHRAVKQGLIRGAHDVSEGGTLTALIEMSINSELGFNLNLSSDVDLFGEGMGMIVFSSAFNHREKIKAHFKSIKRIGNTRDDQIIIVGLEQMNLQECLKHFKGTL
jgi:phosphoribosylformylglycinamidine synthase II/formyltetrahydrofolate-dependent phosphoribosylglycinamide formyltransferase